jgi:hypothetical protein
MRMPSVSDLWPGELVGEQADAGFVAVWRADDADEVVEIGEGDEVGFEQLGELLGLRSSKRVRRRMTSRRCSM